MDAKGVLLLDGGMGRELRNRGVEILDTIWSANALLTAPDVVRQVHRDYIAAGADVITTNTYGVIRNDLAKEGIEDRFAELNLLACALARQARDEAGRPVLIAGSLPPLRGSYRPDLVEPFTVIAPLYREQAALLAPHVDLLLCETMSSAAEALAAVSAAAGTGLPVWVSFTLHDDAPSPQLPLPPRPASRSGSPSRCTTTPLGGCDRAKRSPRRSLLYGICRWRACWRTAACRRASPPP